MILAQSELTSSNTVFALDVVEGQVVTTSPFFVAERQSTVNLQTHSTSTLQEINIQPTTVIAEAQLNSSIVVTSDFQTAGMAVLQANSVLMRQVTISPFIGGVTTDGSSSVVTTLA
jgi:hypothetical protein